MQDWLKQAQAKALSIGSPQMWGSAGTSGGVNYLSSTAGSQSFNVGQLVQR